MPYVDEQARGKDGRRFALELPVGPHVVEVRRLTDRQAQRVTVGRGDPQVLQFTFK